MYPCDSCLKPAPYLSEGMWIWAEGNKGSWCLKQLDRSRRGFQAAELSLTAGNHSPSQDPTWRKVWKKEGQNEAYAFKLREITITSWVLSDNGDGNGTHPPDTVYFTFLKRQIELFLVMACSLIISHNLWLCPICFSSDWNVHHSFSSNTHFLTCFLTNLYSYIKK